MTVEISLVISVASVAFAIYVGIVGIKRGNRKDTEQSAEKLGVIITRLDNIDASCKEIRADMKTVKQDIGNLKERLVCVEQSLSAAWHWIDEFKKVTRKEEK